MRDDSNSESKDGKFRHIFSSSTSRSLSHNERKTSQATKHEQQMKSNSCEYAEKSSAKLPPPPPYLTRWSAGFKSNQSPVPTPTQSVDNKYSSFFYHETFNSKSPGKCPHCYHCLSSHDATRNDNDMNQSGESSFECNTTNPYQELREVLLQRITDEKFGLKVDQIGKEMFVTMVLRNSPAANVGLKVGDEIIRVNGSPASRYTVSELTEIMRHYETELRLTYRPRSIITRVRQVKLHKDTRVGLRLQRRSDGIFIETVIPTSPADEAGLKEGDELLQINEHHIQGYDRDMATELLKSQPPNSDMLISVREIIPVAHVDGCRDPILDADDTASIRAFSLHGGNSPASLSPYH